MCLLLLLLLGFFFHLFFLQHAFFPYLPFNYIETLETIKKKENISHCRMSVCMV